MKTQPMRPRAPSETFLRDALAAKAVKDRLRFMMGYGAISSGPWTVVVGESAIDFRFGHYCPTALGAVAHRESLFACGVGLAELKLALRQLGCVVSAILQPDASDPALLARLYIDEVEEGVDPDAFLLSQALAGPSSSRVPRTIDARIQEELGAHASVERSLLAFTYELPATGTAAACGAPTLASVAQRVAWLDPEPVTVASVATRDPAFDWSTGAIISTRGDSAADWLAAGQALARVALRARVEGFRTRTAGTAAGLVIDRAYAQILLQLGVPRARAAANDTPLQPWQPRRELGGVRRTA
jgi:hypothetical protein